MGSTKQAAIAAATLDAHPLPTLVVDAGFRIVHANAAARALLPARRGATLGDALGCSDAGAALDQRSGGCVFHRAVQRALRGERVHVRSFVLRSSEGGAPADLHLLAFAMPLRIERAAHAVLTLIDMNEILVDPEVVRVCSGCGKIRDEEGEWHPFHRYIEDRLGLELAGELCDTCSRHGRPTRRRSRGRRP